MSGTGDWPLNSPRANLEARHRKQLTFGLESSRSTLVAGLFFGVAAGSNAGTVEVTTDDVTLAAAGTNTRIVAGTLAITTDAVTLAAAGTAGGTGRTGTVAITTGDVAVHAIGQVIGPFAVTTEATRFRLPPLVQPLPPRFVARAVGRARWWR